jgi:hypothetical protein
VELESVAADLERDHVALVAISYDPVEALGDFAAKHGITYPLLSDVGSHVIRALGLLNEGARDNYGIPYPGVFVLDQDGIVVEKRFFASHRERESGVGLIEAALNIVATRHGAEDRASAEAVQVRVSLDSPTFAYWQRLRLTVELTIDAGFHVYGRPVAKGYIPLSIDVEPIDGLVVGDPRWPAAHLWTIAGLDEEFWVYDGVVRVSIPLTFGLPRGTGDQTIRVNVELQACDDTTCLLPARVTAVLPVKEKGFVD